MMNDFEKVMNIAKFYSKVLVKGFVRMVFGAAVAGLFALAVYGFVMVDKESGWTAVCDFIAAIATFACALSGMIVMGGGLKKGAKR